MNFNPQFKTRFKSYSVNSGEKHLLFVDEAPLTISEMYNRITKGLPLSVAKPRCERIPLNNNFYTEGFDVLDLALKNDARIKQEEKEKHLQQLSEHRKQLSEFNEWKKQKLSELNKLHPGSGSGSGSGSGTDSGTAPVTG